MPAYLLGGLVGRLDISGLVQKLKGKTTAF